MKHIFECLLCAIIVIALPIMVSGQQSNVAVCDNIVIKKGDTIHQILKTTRVSLSDFQKANPNIRFSEKRDKNGNRIPLIRPGDIVHIPRVSRARIVAVQPVNTDSVVEQQGREIVSLRRQVNRLLQNNRALAAENAEFLNSIGSIQADMEKLRNEQDVIDSDISGLKVSRDAMRDRLNSLNSQLQKEISDHTNTKFLLMGVCMVIVLFVAVILIWYFSEYIARVGAAQYAKKIADESLVIASNTTDKPRTLEDGKRDAEQMARELFCFEHSIEFGNEPEYFLPFPVEYGVYSGLLRTNTSKPVTSKEVINHDIMVFSFEPTVTSGGPHTAYLAGGDKIFIAVDEDKFSVLGILPPYWSVSFTEKSSSFSLSDMTTVPKFDARSFKLGDNTTSTIN